MCIITGSIGCAFKTSRRKVGERGCTEMQIMQQTIRAARTLSNAHSRALQGK